MSQPEVKGIFSELRTQAMILGGLVAVMWIVEIVDWFLLGGKLNTYGVRPRSVDGLRGILFMPFLHANFAHLTANTLPFVTFGGLIIVRKTSDFWLVTIVTMLVSGLGIWLTGSPYSVHIGASGLIFGYFGFLLLRGYFERSIMSIILSLTVAFLYGGIIWGVLPSQPGISWQGHFFGFVGGVIAAQILGRRNS
ncbi:rhomboid family intramembrane serine protease [Oscillatoriales cyanobacterium USR001]|nr:rhomboid family intramembrane serine protease [Oscillatoriales cyanobacterium USR001]